MTLPKLRQLITSFIQQEEVGTHKFEVSLDEEEIADLTTSLNKGSFGVDFKRVGTAYIIEIKKIEK